MYLPVLPGPAAGYFERANLLTIGGLERAGRRRGPVGVATVGGCCWGPVWVVLFLAVLPVEPAPHHLYLPGVGAGLLLAALLAGVWRAIRRKLRFVQLVEPWASGVVGGVAAGSRSPAA